MVHARVHMIKTRVRNPGTYYVWWVLAGYSVSSKLFLVSNHERWCLLCGIRGYPNCSKLFQMSERDYNRISWIQLTYSTVAVLRWRANVRPDRAARSHPSSVAAAPCATGEQECISSWVAQHIGEGLSHTLLRLCSARARLSLTACSFRENNFDRPKLFLIGSYDLRMSVTILLTSPQLDREKAYIVVRGECERFEGGSICSLVARSLRKMILTV